MGSVGKFFKNLINKNCKNANKENQEFEIFFNLFKHKKNKVTVEWLLLELFQI